MEIMDGVVSMTVSLINFLAETAGVSFEIMCKALIIANNQTEEETNVTR